MVLKEVGEKEMSMQPFNHCRQHGINNCFDCFKRDTNNQFANSYYWDKLMKLGDEMKELDIMCPVVTSVQQCEQHETNEIVKILDEHIFYEKPTSKGLDRVIAKPGTALAVLIQILVSKGVLSLQDVKRALNVGKDS